MNGFLSDTVSCTYDSKKERKKKEGSYRFFFSVYFTANTSIRKKV